MLREINLANRLGLWVSDIKGQILVPLLGVALTRNKIFE
jgi:hypothetical protein